MDNLVGKSYVFEDGSEIKVIQIKNRDYQEEIKPFVTYTVVNGPNLPRKLVMPLHEFIDTYGHLFE